jgi:hypothetical protein
MPLLYDALGGNAYIQEKALKISGELVDHLDFITVKSALFPKVANVFSHTTTLGTKVCTLECFLALVPKLDNVVAFDSRLTLVYNDGKTHSTPAKHQNEGAFGNYGFFRRVCGNGQATEP